MQGHRALGGGGGEGGRREKPNQPRNESMRATNNWSCLERGEGGGGEPLIRAARKEGGDFDKSLGVGGKETLKPEHIE